MDLGEKCIISAQEEVLQKAPDFSHRCRIIRQFGVRKKPSLPIRRRAGQPITSSGLDAEIALEVPPAAMNVIGGITGRVGLDIEELDQERRPLDMVRVRLARFGSFLSEREVNLVQAGSLDLVH